MRISCSLRLELVQSSPGSLKRLTLSPHVSHFSAHSPWVTVVKNPLLRQALSDPEDVICELISTQVCHDETFALRQVPPICVESANIVFSSAVVTRTSTTCRERRKTVNYFSMPSLTFLTADLPFSVHSTSPSLLILIRYRHRKGLSSGSLGAIRIIRGLPAGRHLPTRRWRSRHDAGDKKKVPFTPSCHSGASYQPQE